MIHHLYGVYDAKAKSLVNSFMSINDVTAERSFKALFTTVEDSVFTAHRQDFNLVKIADIDDQKLTDVLVFGSEYSAELLHSERIRAAEVRAEIDEAYNKSKAKFKEGSNNEN